MSTESNVIPINRKRPQRLTKISGYMEAAEIREVLRLATPEPKKPVVSPLLDDLEEASSDYLINKLKLQHRREAMNRELGQLEAENETALEEAAYFAFLNGVPEDEIYEQDTFSGQALENAIRKVQALA